MTAFVRTQADSAWIAGYTPGQADFEDWDRKVAASVNGDDGGTWAPSTPIVITNGVGGAETAILCPVKVCYGARFTTASGGRFAISGPKFEQLAPGHVGSTRALLTPMAGAIVEPAAAAARLLLRGAVQVSATRWLQDLAPPPSPPPFSGSIETWSVGPFAESAVHTTALLRTHDGASLSSVTLTWIGMQGRPRARLVRYDINGDATPITLAAAGADADGWVMLPAPDAALNVQSSMIACDPGVIVDKSLYSYALQIVEDQTLENKVYLLKQPARVASTSNVSPLSGAPVIDGVQTVAGDIILLRAQDDPRQNGLWYVWDSGTHLHPVGITSFTGSLLAGTLAYMTSPGIFPAGYVVPVMDGATLAGTSWQMTLKGGGPVGKFNTFGSDNFEIVGSDGRVLASWAQTFEPFALGNTYLAAVANHTGITDTRWQ